MAATALAAFRPPPAGAQERPDTLMFDIAVVTLPPAHLAVEARLTTSAAGAVALSVPPAALPAGTDVEGLSVTDDHGAPLQVRRSGPVFEVAAPAGAIRFRYRLDFQSGIALSSTG